LRDEDYYRHMEREVREAVERKYEPELAATNGYKRLVVYWKMRRELWRELDILAPERGLYFQEYEREKLVR
jgi:hypothetical protein